MQITTGKSVKLDVQISAFEEESCYKLIQNSSNELILADGDHIRVFTFGFEKLNASSQWDEVEYFHYMLT